MLPAGPKMAPRWPHDGPKMAPRWPQDGPRRPKMTPGWLQEGPKRTQDGSKMDEITEGVRKMREECSKMGIRAKMYKNLRKTLVIGRI